MPEGGFPVAVIGGVPVVAAPEEIDMTNSGGLLAALLDAPGNGHKRLVVDMTRTRFCDSSGIHVLAATHRRTRHEGRQLLLVISDTAVLRAFAIVGIDQMIPIFPSVADAFRHADVD
jgi:anti-sigma B factor antagonist